MSSEEEELGRGGCQSLGPEGEDAVAALSNL